MTIEEALRALYDTLRDSPGGTGRLIRECTEFDEAGEPCSRSPKQILAQVPFESQLAICNSMLPRFVCAEHKDVRPPVRVECLLPGRATISWLVDA